MQSNDAAPLPIIIVLRAMERAHGWWVIGCVNVDEARESSTKDAKKWNMEVGISILKPPPHTLSGNVLSERAVRKITEETWATLVNS